MPKFLGLISKRSPTPNERIQQSKSNTVGGYTGEGQTSGGIDKEVVAEITKLLRSGGQCRVYHRYRHFTANPGVTDFHHSQIFVANAEGEVLFNFGLWSNDNDKIEFGQDENVQYYRNSTTYAPNPVQVSSQKFLDAFVATRRKCGPDYKLLHNNCQKFARLLMTELGATHKRSLFHL